MKSRTALTVILLAYFSLFFLGLIDNLRSTLFPVILNKFNLNNSQGAWFFILTSIFSIVGGISTHRLCLYISSLAAWRWGILAMGLGSFWIYQAEIFFSLLIGCSVLGLGFGVLAVTQNILITSVSHSSSKQKALAGLHSMYGLASFISPLLVTLFTSRSWPWPNLFLGGAFAIGILGLSSLYFKAPSSPRPKDEMLSTNPPSRTRWFAAITMASYVAMELLISTRLTTYLIQHHHWTIEQASQALTYFFIALLAGRILFSVFHPPIATHKILLLSLIGAMALILFGLRMNPLWICLSGFLMAPFYPLMMTWISEQFPAQLSSTVSLTISLQSFFAILMNLTLGYFSDQFGIQTAMYSAFFFGGLSWLLLIL